MKRMVLGLALACLLVANAGCHCCGDLLGGRRDCRSHGPCDACGGIAGGCGLCNGNGLGYGGEGYAGTPGGPAAGAVTYPYYTLRGPRDFLACHPRGVGP